MINDIRPLRLGLSLSMLILLFGIGMGILFGINEDAVKDYIADGVAAHQSVHDEKSTSKIWRYAQRSHFHATGVGAFALAMILLAGASNLTRKLKFSASTLVGIGSFYSLAWLSMFLLAPGIGRDAAHHSFLTWSITSLTIGCLLIGMAIIMMNLLFNFGSHDQQIQ
jgi:hypothetical protein